jgi:hypothetical protein
MHYSRAQRPGPMDNLQALPLSWIVAGLAAPPMLILVIRLVVLLIAPPLQNPPSTGLRGIFLPQRSSPFFFYGINAYSLNFANPWAWVYLVVVGLLMIAPFFFASVLIRHLLANLIN